MSECYSAEKGSESEAIIKMPTYSPSSLNIYEAHSITAVEKNSLT